MHINRPSAAWKRFLGEHGARRLAILAGKCTAGTIAAGTGLALGFRELKKTPDYRDPKDLWSDAAFDLNGRLGAGTSALIDRLCSHGGVDRRKFRMAARRLRPVELDLLELQESLAAKGVKPNSAEEKEELKRLTTRWQEAGYFDDADAPARAEVFGRRLTSDAQGADVSALVPPALLREDDVQAVTSPSWEPSPAVRLDATESVARWGCALLRGAVSQEDVAELRRSLGLGLGASSRRAKDVGQWLQQTDANVSMGRYTVGRLHCLLRGSSAFESAAVSAHSAVAPLVHTFFQKEQSEGRRVFLSEAQLVVADPCAEDQTWHLDRVGNRGLSVFIPLSNISVDRGQQAVLPGSHHLNDSSLSLRQRLRQSLKCLCATHGSVIASASPESVWSAGDALVFDSRLLHRALKNDGLGAPTAVLVLRYDLQDSPPPGCSRFRLRAMTYLGSGLDALFRFYAAV